MRAQVVQHGIEAVGVQVYAVAVAVVLAQAAVLGLEHAGAVCVLAARGLSHRLYPLVGLGDVRVVDGLYLLIVVLDGVDGVADYLGALSFFIVDENQSEQMVSSLFSLSIDEINENKEKFAEESKSKKSNKSKKKKENVISNNTIDSITTTTSNVVDSNAIVVNANTIAKSKK